MLTALVSSQNEVTSVKRARAAVLAAHGQKVGQDVPLVGTS